MDRQHSTFSIDSILHPSHCSAHRGITTSPKLQPSPLFMIGGARGGPPLSISSLPYLQMLMAQNLLCPPFLSVYGAQDVATGRPAASLLSSPRNGTVNFAAHCEAGDDDNSDGNSCYDDDSDLSDASSVRDAPSPRASPGAVGIVTQTAAALRASDRQPAKTLLKKKRTAFTRLQLQELESKFCQQKYLTKRDRCALAKAIGLTEKHVKTWYQNRRTKWKRDCSEADWSKQREHAATLMYSQYLQVKTSTEGLNS